MSQDATRGRPDHERGRSYLGQKSVLDRMEDMQTALVVDDDTGFRERLAAHLRAAGVAVTTTTQLERMQEVLAAHSPDWVVFEPNLPRCHWYRVMTELASF